MSDDWTVKDGRSNSSDEFIELVDFVDQLIRRSAHSLLAGHSKQVARLIMAQLVHAKGLAPRSVHAEEKSEKEAAEASVAKCGTGCGWGNTQRRDLPVGHEPPHASGTVCPNCGGPSKPLDGKIGIVWCHACFDGGPDGARRRRNKAIRRPGPPPPQGGSWNCARCGTEHEAALPVCTRCRPIV